MTGRIRKVELRASGIGASTWDRDAATQHTNLAPAVP
jgi:hypothetical protein